MNGLPNAHMMSPAAVLKGDAVVVWGMLEIAHQIDERQFFSEKPEGGFVARALNALGL